MKLNIASLQTQYHRPESAEGKLRFDNNSTQKDASTISRGSNLTPVPTNGISTSSAKTNHQSSEPNLEERLLRVRLNRLILHESQLRQKLSGAGIEAESSNEFGGDDRIRQNNLQKSDRVEAPAIKTSSIYDQELLDQILLEKQVLQRRLEALDRNTHGSGVGLFYTAEGAGSISESQSAREPYQKSLKEEGEELEVTLLDQQSTLSPPAFFESVLIKHVNIEQVHGSVDNLLSSRQSLIDQYYRDGDLDFLLNSLEKQDKYMEAVMSALLPQRKSSEVLIKGELINVRV